MGKENRFMEIENVSQNMLWAILNTLDYKVFDEGEVHLVKPGEVADAPFYTSPIILVSASGQSDHDNSYENLFTPNRQTKNVNNPYQDISYKLQQPPHLSAKEMIETFKNIQRGIIVIDNNRQVRFLRHGRNESKVVPLELYAELRYEGSEIHDFYFTINDHYPTHLSFLGSKNMVRLNGTDGLNVPPEHKKWLELIVDEYKR